MHCLKSLLLGSGGVALGVFFWSLGVATAQQAPQYPQDDKLANEPAPWTVPGKWGKRGNWGRWGENDKRGMLNYITPDMIVKAAGLVKQGKVYALGEELHADVPRVITPQRMGIIDTVSTVFNIEQSDYKIIESFVLQNDSSSLAGYEDLLIVNSEVNASIVYMK